MWPFAKKPVKKEPGISKKAPTPELQIAQIPDFLSEEAVARYLDFSRSPTDLWDKGNIGTRWDSRVIHSNNMPAELEKMTISVLVKVKAAIQSSFPAAPSVYPDGLSLVRWFTNDFQEPHADAENPDGQPHPFHWRKYAALIYLNRDFGGGDLYFPNKDLRIKPQPRSLVLFPGTTEYLHEVERITQGTRYTLASFWTDERPRSIYPEVFTV